MLANNGECFRMACENEHTKLALWLTKMNSSFILDESALPELRYSIKVELPINTNIIKHVKNEEDKNCIICYETTVELQTPCGHNFCKKCIEIIYEKTNNQTCPYCRSELNIFYKICDNS
tara:strand:- start:180 stop:539 length:360 start_codon:yes stop_codon:yes gene_type:complete